MSDHGRTDTRSGRIHTLVIDVLYCPVMTKLAETRADGDPKRAAVYPVSATNERVAMNTIGVDASGTKLDTWDGTKHETWRGFEEMLAAATEPTRFVVEASFESFEDGRRQQAIDLAEELGHEFLTTPNDMTRREARRQGIEKKSDKIDAQMIYAIATNGRTHLSRLHVHEDRKEQMQARANEIGIDLRNHYVPRPTARAKTRISQKLVKAKELQKLLPEFKGLDPMRKKAVGSAKSYSDSVIVDMWIVARVVREFDGNRDDADFLMGLYGSAYGSVIKATLNRRFQWGDNGLFTEMSFGEYRKHMRWLWHRMDEVVTGGSLPETGGPKP